MGQIKTSAYSTTVSSSCHKQMLREGSDRERTECLSRKK